MSRYIDADKYKAMLEEEYEKVIASGKSKDVVDGITKFHLARLAEIDSIPTADVVEVAVRCKNCIYFRPDKSECHKIRGMRFLTKADDYCLSGERKEE